MLTQLCSLLRNYFLRDYNNPDASIHHGKFIVTGGRIQPLSFLQDGQYFRVIGSVFNDGVWQYDPNGEGNGPMHDETFDGTIWAMCVPRDFLDLAAEIEAWSIANADSLNSPYQSESLGSGGYSYSRASGGSQNDLSLPYGWQNQFAQRLRLYRRPSVL